MEEWSFRSEVCRRGEGFLDIGKFQIILDGKSPENKPTSFQTPLSSQFRPFQISFPLVDLILGKRLKICCWRFLHETSLQRCFLMLMLCRCAFFRYCWLLEAEVVGMVGELRISWVRVRGKNGSW